MMTNSPVVEETKEPVYKVGFNAKEKAKRRAKAKAERKARREFRKNAQSK